MDPGLRRGDGDEGDHREAGSGATPVIPAEAGIHPGPSPTVPAGPDVRGDDPRAAASVESELDNSSTSEPTLSGPAPTREPAAAAASAVASGELTTRDAPEPAGGTAIRGISLDEELGLGPALVAALEAALAPRMASDLAAVEAAIEAAPPVPPADRRLDDEEDMPSITMSRTPTDHDPSA